jgi:hypothetical protein
VIDLWIAHPALFAATVGVILVVIFNFVQTWRGK